MGGRGARSRFEALGIIAREPSEIREIKSANEAKDFDELGQYMWDAHGITLEDEVSNLDFTAVRDNLQGLEDVLKEFPRAENMLYAAVSVGVDTRNENYYADTDLYGRVALYYQRFKIGGDLRQSYSREAASGQFVANSNYTDVLRHEAGHLLAIAISQKTAQWISNPDERHAMLSDDWRYHIPETQIINAAFRSMQKGGAGERQTLDAAIRSVSNYASENMGEAFAECITDYSRNGENANRLSKEVWKLVKKELG